MDGELEPGGGGDTFAPVRQLSTVEQEKLAKTARENQQILLYLFVVAVIALAWLLGMFGSSFLWIFALISLTFLVWWGKVISLTEAHIKYQELLLHRKRALRQNETAEWINFVLNRWWVFSQTSISNLVKKNLDPLLMTVKPAFVESIELDTFSLGECTPFVQFVKVFEVGEGGKKPMSWMSINQPPPGLPQAQYYQAVIEADVGLQSEEFKMVFRTRLGGKWMGMNMDIAVEKLNISGKMQFLVNFNMDTAFPHISTVTISFLEKPEVWFAIRVMRAVQMMEIPVLKSWIHSLVMDGLTQALVDPGKVDIRFESSGPSYAPAPTRSKAKAKGVLTITVHLEHVKGNMFADDIRYCTLRLGEQKQHTQETQGAGTWQDTCSFLVDDLKTDHVYIKSKSKRLLSTYTLAQFDVLLADYPFEHKPVIETTLEDDKASKWPSPGQTRINLTMEYTPLTSVNTEVQREAEQPVPISQALALNTSTPELEFSENMLAVCMAGVMHVSVHSAHNLLALDRNGFSDPYCIIFSNGKKLKTTHYICKTRNPVWEVSTEFLVGDFTKTMLSFLVYDWDGHNATDDDFLGSAYILLSLDEPVVIKRSLTLGYNLQRVGQVDNMKLGAITVSVVFRPVASVAKSEGNITVTNVSYQEYQASRQRSFMTSAKNDIATLLVHTGLQWGKKNKLSASKDKGVADLLSMGYGILELNIKQAKDLVPMDSNGFSDPYVEVRIGSERKFTTSIKKKTLNPVWDEWVTMQMPRPNEVLEIVVWDRDPFFKKDFLGTVLFTIEELKKFSSKPLNDGWFQLQRIRSGYIQLFFNVISEDVSEGGLQSVGSESVDSGVQMSSTSNSPRDDDVHKSPRPQPPNMSPIHESLPDANGYHGNKREDEVFTTAGAASETSTPSVADNQPSRKRLNPLHINRSASDVSMRDKKPRAPKLALTERGCNEESPKGALRKTDSLPARLDKDGKRRFWKRRNSTMGESASLNELAGLYFNVRGHVLRGKGLPSTAPQVYCKVRLDKHAFDERRSKHSSGKVLGKSVHVDVLPGSQASFDVPFEVDKGQGTSGESTLIFDIKTSKKDHLATRHMRIRDLLIESAGSEMTQWLDMGQGVELEVKLAYDPSHHHTNSLPRAKLKHRFTKKHKETEIL